MCANNCNHSDNVAQVENENDAQFIADFNTAIYGAQVAQVESADDDSQQIDCAECGREIRETESALNDDGTHYCADCVCVCDLCSETVPETTTTTYERQTSRGIVEDVCVCEDCEENSAALRSCDFCSETYISSRAYHPWASCVCRSCSEDAYSCDDCGCILHSEDTHSDHNGDGTYCEGCIPEYDDEDDCDDDECEDSSRIYCASQKISSKLFGARADLKLGIELEVECERGSRADCADDAWRLFADQYVIFKDDGSLNNGFEIVTRPASLETHKAELKDFLDKRPVALRSHDTKTCGLHIHLDRASLSDLQIGKIAAFLYCASSQSFVNYIAGRKPNGYCARDLGDSVAKGAMPKSCRYYAVNICDNTVELRLFRGTLKRETLYARLEFAHAVATWAKDVSVRTAESADCISDFAQFIKRERKRYPNLGAKFDEYCKRQTEEMTV
jgi:hypothetical protein